MTDAPSADLDELLAEAEEEETELDKLMRLMLDPANIEHNTELSRREIKAYSVLGPRAEKYGLECLKQYLARNLKLKVSKDRKGRVEWVKIASKARGDKSDEEERAGARGVWRRF